VRAQCLLASVTSRESSHADGSNADTVLVAVNQPAEAHHSGAARRVARNTAVRSIGEIVGKFATFAMFVIIARRLGPRGFGDITFAIALTGQLQVIAGFGMDIVLSREAIRKPALLGSLMGNSLVLKLITSVPALLVVAIVVQAGNYSSATRIAVYLIGISTLLDTLENTWNAAFQVYERQELFSLIVAFQRVVNGLLVVAVVAAGGGVIPVAGTFVVVSVATILFAMWLLRFVVSPEWSFQRDRLLPLLRAAFPVGLSVVLLSVLVRIDMVLLSLFAGNREVGIYGAGFRIFESTMFVTLVFTSVIFPWFSRKHFEGSTEVARGYEISLAVLVSILTPIGLACILVAGPIVHTLYGTRYDASITPLRLLGTVVIAYGINTLTSSMLAANDRPRLMHRILLITLVQNIVMNVLLIPPYGATGAALSAAVSGVLLGALSIRQATKSLGRIRVIRIFVGPVAGAAAMTIAVILVWGSLIGSLAFGGAAYVTALFLVQRTFFPDDFTRLLDSVRPRARST
jgi:O-antigen/teichoic acid export membrane protein